MKKLIYLAAAALLTFFACTPEDKEKIEEIVNPKEVVATAIELSSHELTLEKGANSILTVTYTPSDVTKKDITWVSSNTSIATVNDGIVVGVEAGGTEIIAKCGDATDKCKVTVVISATSIKLNKTSLELHLHDTEALIATIEPDNTTDSIVWESSDEGVATVDGGVVTAVGAGDAAITAKAGNQKAECKVSVSAFPNGAVDLGIVVTRKDGSTYNLYWAKSNLSTSGLCANPEDYGDYFAWGETEPYYTSQDPLTWKDGKTGYNWASYKWCNGDYNILTKYCPAYKTDYWDGDGSPDDKTTLDPEDDAAHVILGGNWRMPTFEEWKALATQCTGTQATENGVIGYEFTGPNGNSIFLPYANFREGTSIMKASGTDCVWCWSSSLYTDRPSDRPDFAQFVRINWSEIMKYHALRYLGMSIRPVTE